MNKLFRNKSWLIEQYIIKKRYVKDIANECNCSQNTIFTWLKKFNIKTIHTNIDIDLIKIINELKKEKSVKSISKQLNLSYYVILKRLKNNNIVFKKDINKELTKNKLKELYFENKLPKYKIAKLYKISINTVNMLFKKFKFKKRTRSEVALLCDSMEKRKRKSATSQGIKYEEWKSFRKPLIVRLRNSYKYKEWKKKVLSKYNCCQCCGTSKKLEAHHIESFVLNKEKRFDVNNGIILCHNCHENFHNIFGTIFFNQQKYNEYINNYKFYQNKEGFEEYNNDDILEREYKE